MADEKPLRDWETWKRDRAVERQQDEIERNQPPMQDRPSLGAIGRQAQSAAEFFATAGPEEIARLICRPYTPRKALKRSE